MTESNRDTPGVIAWPPLIVFIPLALAITLNYFAPRPFLPPEFRLILAAPFIAPGAFLGGWAL